MHHLSVSKVWSATDSFHMEAVSDVGVAVHTNGAVENSRFQTSALTEMGGKD